MNYALGYAFNLQDMFHNFKTNKLSISCKECVKLFKTDVRAKVAQRIFKESAKIILQDVIDNNVTFELPTGKQRASIYIKRFNEDKFVAGRKNGKWRDIDFLTSDFSGYQMVFEYITKGFKKEKPIYLSKYLKNQITENTNNGKQYC